MKRNETRWEWKVTEDLTQPAQPSLQFFVGEKVKLQKVVDEVENYDFVPLI